VLSPQARNSERKNLNHKGTKTQSKEQKMQIDDLTMIPEKRQTIDPNIV